MYKPKSVFLLIVILSFFLQLVGAEDKIFVLGGASGWPTLSYSSGLSFSKGRLGQEALVLATDTVRDITRSSSDDLYITFDDTGFRDETGNYSVVSSSLLYADARKAQRGTGAALCNTSGSGLVLQGKTGSLFSTPGNPLSFTIDFWLFPAVTENGSVLFQWRSSRNAPSGALYQYIRASLFRNHLEWSFSNIWTTVTDGKSPSGKPLDIIITGRKNLIPGEWSHHQLSFDANTGLLEYCLNGSTENILYLTSSGTEAGDVYPAIFGAPSDVEIATRFSGLIDEFKISRFSTDLSSLESRRAVLDRYSSGGGRFESLPLDSLGLNSSLKKVSAVISEPSETGSAFFVRSGEDKYLWTDTYPAWIPVQLDGILSGVKGRYFQISAELYPDGRGLKSPTLTSVSLLYELDSLPWPPAKVFALVGDNSVTLNWAASINTDTAGYVVYYGERPGEYLSEGSPVDAGKKLSFTVDGLKNGKLYYFSVAAYDESGASHPGSLSLEVYARPKAAHMQSGN